MSAHNLDLQAVAAGTQNLIQRPLDIRDIDQVLCVQQKDLRALPEDQDWVHQKRRDDYAELLTHPSHQMIGVFTGDRLLSFSACLFPTPDEPDADMQEMALPGPPESLTVLSAVMRDPSFIHPGGLMRPMVCHWLELARQRDRAHALGMITQNNQRSWSRFVEAGVHIVGCGTDVSDGSTVYYAHGRISSLRPHFDPVQHQARSVPVEPEMPLTRLQQLFNEGYVGVAPERSPESGRMTGRLITIPRSCLNNNSLG